MRVVKNIKIWIGLFYLLLFLAFLYYVFSKFSIEEITTYKFIQSNMEYFDSLRKENIILLSFVFILLSIAWVLLQGFASPLALLAGFLFGKWTGTLLVAISLSIGAVLVYVFASYFFKDLIKEKFLKKFNTLRKKFTNNEFLFILIYRFIGGIPFQIVNLLPVLFNFKVKNYFFGTFFGMIPQLFIIASLGSGFEQIISKNNAAPEILKMLSSKEIYLPVLGFIFLVLISLVVKKIFYKN